MLDITHPSNKSFKPLIVGFIISVLLTTAAYLFAQKHLFNSWSLILMVVGFGCLQAVIQLYFFFHLGIESKPRWNMMTFLFTVLVIFIVIAGSVWIMRNLDYNLMTNM